MMRHLYVLMAAAMLSSAVAAAKEIPAPGEFGSIQKAIDAAKPGDVVKLAEGKFQEALALRDGVCLAGAGADKTIIQAPIGSVAALTASECKKGKISGIAFVGSWKTGDAEVEEADRTKGLVTLEGCSLSVEDCAFRAGTSNGLAISGKGKSVVKGCQAEANGRHGIYVSDEGAEAEVVESKCEKNNMNGILFRRQAAGTIRKNVCLENSLAGIMLSYPGSAPAVEGNECSRNCTHGILVGMGANGATLKKNVCRENDSCGIAVLDKGSAATLVENECAENKLHGISVAAGGKVEALGNLCHENFSHGIFASQITTVANLSRNECIENRVNGIGYDKRAAGTADGNRSVGNICSGIFVFGLATAPTLRNNACIDNRRSGIGFEPKAQPVIEENNKVEGNDKDCYNELVQRMLRDKKYSELQALADRLVKDKSRYPNGNWQMDSFYWAAAGGWPEARMGGHDLLIPAIEAWMKERPKSSTPRIALALVYINDGWDDRGGGLAKDVTDEGWQGFHTKLEKARALLQEAAKLEPKDPQVYAELLRLGNGVSDPPDKMDEYFQKGIEIEPAYYPLYHQRAYSLTPRWGGSREELEAFASRAPKIANDGEGNGIYARIAIGLTSTLHEEGYFTDADFPWKSLKEAFLDIRKSNPRSRFHLNWFCLMACLNEDKETAKALFKELGENPDLGIWPSLEGVDRWKRWAAGEGPYLGSRGIFGAASRGSVSSIKKYLDEGGNIDLRNARGQNFLMIAAQNGDERLGEYLLRRGADPNTRDDKGYAPLVYAGRFPSFCKLLQAHGAK